MAEKEKLSKEEKAAQNAVIKEIMADFGLEGVTKKRLSRYHREQRELGYTDDRVPTEAGADCRDVRGEGSLKNFAGGRLISCLRGLFLERLVFRRVYVG